VSEVVTNLNTPAILKKDGVTDWTKMNLQHVTLVSEVVTNLNTPAILKKDGVTDWTKMQKPANKECWLCEKK
jgi:hypothetical protein